MSDPSMKNEFEWAFNKEAFEKAVSDNVSLERGLQALGAFICIYNLYQGNVGNGLGAGAFFGGASYLAHKFGTPKEKDFYLEVTPEDNAPELNQA